MDWFDEVLREFTSLSLFLPFIPLFVAFDALGILLIFVSLTSEMTQLERKKVVHHFLHSFTL
jgi:small neutral amino acid transporter SnatA (MarC family)